MSKKATDYPVKQEYGSGSIASGHLDSPLCGVAAVPFGLLPSAPNVGTSRVLKLCGDVAKRVDFNVNARYCNEFSFSYVPLLTGFSSWLISLHSRRGDESLNVNWLEWHARATIYYFLALSMKRNAWPMTFYQQRFLDDCEAIAFKAGGWPVTRELRFFLNCIRRIDVRGKKEFSLLPGLPGDDCFRQMTLQGGPTVDALRQCTLFNYYGRPTLPLQIAHDFISTVPRRRYTDHLDPHDVAWMIAGSVDGVEGRRAFEVVHETAYAEMMDYEWTRQLRAGDCDLGIHAEIVPTEIRSLSEFVLGRLEGYDRVASILKTIRHGLYYDEIHSVQPSSLTVDTVAFEEHAGLNRPEDIRAPVPFAHYFQNFGTAMLTVHSVRHVRSA